MSKYEILTPHEAAKRMHPHLDRERHFTICRGHMEGRHIPEGTFNEFVHELKGFGLCIDEFVPNKRVMVTGQHPTFGGIVVQVI